MSNKYYWRLYDLNQGFKKNLIENEFDKNKVSLLSASDEEEIKRNIEHDNALKKQYILYKAFEVISVMLTAQDQDVVAKIDYLLKIFPEVKNAHKLPDIKNVFNKEERDIFKFLSVWVRLISIQKKLEKLSTEYDQEEVSKKYKSFLRLQKIYSKLHTDNYNLDLKFNEVVEQFFEIKCENYNFVSTHDLKDYEDYEDYENYPHLVEEVFIKRMKDGGINPIDYKSHNLDKYNDLLKKQVSYFEMYILEMVKDFTSNLFLIKKPEVFNIADFLLKKATISEKDKIQIKNSIHIFNLLNRLYKAEKQYKSRKISDNVYDLLIKNAVECIDLFKLNNSDFEGLENVEHCINEKKEDLSLDRKIKEEEACTMGFAIATTGILVTGIFLSSAYISKKYFSESFLKRDKDLCDLILNNKFQVVMVGVIGSLVIAGIVALALHQDEYYREPF